MSARRCWGLDRGWGAALEAVGLRRQARGSAPSFWANRRCYGKQDTPGGGKPLAVTGQCRRLHGAGPPEAARGFHYSGGLLGVAVELSLQGMEAEASDSLCQK